jgi:hypothetical protein
MRISGAVRSGIAVALALTSVACVRIVHRPDATPSCPPAPPLREEPQLANPYGLAGGYRLTLVSESLNSRGQRVSGVLWLWPSSAADSSVARGVRAVGDPAVMPYYGNTNINVDSFKASPETSQAYVRQHTDPVYPPVLVTFMRGEYEGKPRAELTLWYGSLANARDGRIGLDGAGYDFHVTEQSERGFSGRWGPAGIVATDTGYFCARRIGP